jgi:hypothetical protein
LASAVGAPAGAGTWSRRRTGTSPARSLLNGYGLLQFTPNPKNPRSPELVKEKKYKTIRHTDNTKKQVGYFFTNINNKKSTTHINADTKLKIIQNVNTITK